MNSLDILINQERKDYLCFDMLKQLYNTNPEFKEFIDKGLKEQKISGFTEELWKAIEAQNIRGLKTFEDVFKDGYNIGGQTVVSRQLSYSFPECTLCTGTLPIVMDSKLIDEETYSWMTSDGYIYDTALMLIMDREYANRLGYQYVIEYDPHQDPIYQETYEFTNNQEIKNARNR